MRCYCLVCNNFFDGKDLLVCPHCGAVGDDIEVDEENKGAI